MLHRRRGLPDAKSTDVTGNMVLAESRRVRTLGEGRQRAGHAWQLRDASATLAANNRADRGERKKQVGVGSTLKAPAPGSSCKAVHARDTCAGTKQIISHRVHFCTDPAHYPNLVLL